MYSPGAVLPNIKDGSLPINIPMKTAAFIIIALIASWLVLLAAILWRVTLH